jgi:hypothetical protein
VLGQEGAEEFGEGTLGFYASKKMVTKVRGVGEGGLRWERVQGVRGGDGWRPGWQQEDGD